MFLSIFLQKISVIFNNMQYGKLKKSQQNRDCLPEIATGAKAPSQ